MKLATLGVATLCLGTVMVAPGMAPVSAQTTADTCFGQSATIVGTDGDDTLTGSPGPDVIVGLGGNDTIAGLGGADLLCGGDGADVLTGGAGDDKLSGGLDDVRDVTGDGFMVDFGDTLVPGPGDDEVSVGYVPDVTKLYNGWVGDTISFAGSTHGVHVDLSGARATGQGHDRLDADQVDMSVQVIGSAHADVIKGTPQGDYVDAGGGDDTVSTGAGDDSAVDAGGSDVYRLGRGQDRASSRQGHDRVYGGQGPDILAADRVSSPGALLSGGPGSDQLTGVRVGARYRYQGGPGRDFVHLWIYNLASARNILDLRHGSFRHGRLRSPVSSVSIWEVHAHGPDRVIGTSHNDALYLWGASATGRLGAGDDQVWVHRMSHGTGLMLGAGADQVRLNVRGPSTVRLGSGNDQVFGFSSPAPHGLQDLYGGPGRDSVQVYPGRYRCHHIERGTCHYRF